MPQLIVDNKSINYKDIGDGPVIVCIHGWMHNLSSYNQLTDELKDSFRVISLDLPNFGDSEISEGCITISDYGNFIQSFVSKLSLENYTIIGHSMGGQMIINAVAKGVISPDKIVLIASAGVRDHRSVYKLFLRLCSKLLRHVTPKHIKNKIYNKLGSDYNTDLSDIHKKIINQTLSTDIVEEAEKVDKPTLLIYGSRDTSTPLWMGEKLTSRINGSKLEVIKDENHWLHQTSSKQVGDYIRKFLNEKNN